MRHSSIRSWWYLLSVLLATISAGAAHASTSGATYYAHGQAAFKARYFGMAARDYEQAIIHGYQGVGTYYQLGVCYTHLRRWNVALWAYDTVALLDPGFAAAHRNVHRQQNIAHAHGGRDNGPPPILASARLIVPSSLSSPPSPRIVGKLASRHARASIIKLLPLFLVITILCGVLIFVSARRAGRAYRNAPDGTGVELTSSFPVSDATSEVQVTPDSPSHEDLGAPSSCDDPAPPIPQTETAPHSVEGDVLFHEAEAARSRMASLSSPGEIPDGNTAITIARAPAGSPSTGSLITRVENVPAISDGLSVLVAAALARPLPTFLRCPKLLPRRPQISLFDEIEHVREVLQDHITASQFVRRVLLWPALVLPPYASVDGYGKEALRVYYLLGIVDRVRRTNSTRITDMLPPGLDSASLPLYCGACLVQRLNGMNRTLHLLARGTPVTAERLAAAVPVAGPGVLWDIEEAHRRLTLLLELRLVVKTDAAYKATASLVALEKLVGIALGDLNSLEATEPRRIPALATSHGQLQLPASGSRLPEPQTPRTQSFGAWDAPGTLSGVSQAKSLDEAIAELDLLEDYV